MIKKSKIKQSPIEELEAGEIGTSGMNMLISTAYMPSQTAVRSQENDQKIIQETRKNLELRTATYGNL